MIYLPTFLKATLLTFTILLAIGPVFLTLVNTFLTRGVKHGIVAAMGVTMMDFIYILTSVLFIHKVEKYLNGSILFDIFGCCILFYLGFKFLLQKEVGKSKEVAHKTLFKTWLGMFLLTGSSPTTVIAYAGLFASLSAKLNDPISAIFGGFCGTTLFYTIVSTIMSLVHKKFNEKKLLILAKIGGFIILCFGINQVHHLIHLLTPNK
jgi:threonine/homoserine/homoserine lactone efflux protein